VGVSEVEAGLLVTSVSSKNENRDSLLAKRSASDSLTSKNLSFDTSGAVDKSEAAAVAAEATSSVVSGDVFRFLKKKKNNEEWLEANC